MTSRKTLHFIDISCHLNITIIWANKLQVWQTKAYSKIYVQNASEGLETINLREQLTKRFDKRMGDVWPKVAQLVEQDTFTAYNKITALMEHIVIWLDLLGDNLEECTSERNKRPLSWPSFDIEFGKVESNLDNR